MESSKIQLKTKEGKVIEITKKQAELSELLKATINEYPNETSFPLNELEEKNAEKIKDFLTHYNGVPPSNIEKPLPSIEMRKVTDEWSANFVDKMSIEELTNLTMAAHYMGINSLLDLCCAKVASLCKDKNEDDIFKTFNITATFNDEEKNIIKEENKWIDENL